MNEPTPKRRSDWAQAVTLCVLFVSLGAVCIAGMLIRADILR